MTTLDSYLAAVYDAAAEAETLALINGQRRLRRMVESGRLPEDASVPVYHAADLSVTLDVGLEARETEGETELVVTESNDDTAIDIDLEVYDMLEAGSLPESEFEPGGPDTVDVHLPIPDASDEDGGSDGDHTPRTSLPTRGSGEREEEDEPEREEEDEPEREEEDEPEREERPNEGDAPEGRGNERRGDDGGGVPSARRSAGSEGLFPFDLDAVMDSEPLDPLETDPDDGGP